MTEKEYIQDICNKIDILILDEESLKENFEKEISKTTIKFIQKNSSPIEEYVYFTTFFKSINPFNTDFYIDLSETYIEGIYYYEYYLLSISPKIFVKKFPQSLRSFVFDKFVLDSIKLKRILIQLKFLDSKVISIPYSIESNVNNILKKFITDFDIYKFPNKTQEFIINYISFLEESYRLTSKFNYPKPKYYGEADENINFFTIYEKHFDELIKLKNDYLKIENHKIEF